MIIDNNSGISFMEIMYSGIYFNIVISNGLNQAGLRKARNNPCTNEPWLGQARFCHFPRFACLLTDVVHRGPAANAHKYCTRLDTRIDKIFDFFLH